MKMQGRKWLLWSMPQSSFSSYNDPSLVKARQDALLIELSTIFIGGGSIKGAIKQSKKLINIADDITKWLGKNARKIVNKNNDLETVLILFNNSVKH
ncbi:MAG: hypothetical protein U5L09_15855 [Bacteroidales bacterium]|nr:hypothetical protein [Bacteroidales bacterium]